MDSWQEHIHGRLFSFVTDNPSNLEDIDDVKMVINSREAYVLLNIMNEWKLLLKAVTEPTGGKGG